MDACACAFGMWRGISVACQCMRHVHVRVHLACGGAFQCMRHVHVRVHLAFHINYVNGLQTVWVHKVIVFQCWSCVVLDMHDLCCS